MLGRLAPERAERHAIRLSDGDQLIVHDDCPEHWRDGQGVVLLIHGLCGSHRSNYMVRIAEQLQQRGLRTYRLDMRGCGAGRGLAQHPYHSGRSDDIRQALWTINQRHPRSPLHAIGFSLSANTLLKMLGEVDLPLPANLRSAVAVSPPVDLAASVRALRSLTGRFYDWYFTRSLVEHVCTHPRLGESAQHIFAPRNASCLYDFDQRFTAPLSGFSSADHYYHTCSSAALLPHIRIPTTIISAKDDPVVPWQPLHHYAHGPNLSLHLTDYGGHLGFIAREQPCRWMDALVISSLLRNA
jgi:uncharacterized protein